MTKKEALKWSVRSEKWETLQKTCVTGKSEKQDSLNEKMKGKLSKDVWHSSQHNCVDGSKITQNKVLKMSFNLKSTYNCYKDL